ncbi:hypothetical protein LTR50_003256 [Elasticomyces elasticus]|nr:hypothetical protein LTR50_003256 [Elasticomyces elasticus]
MSQDQGNEPHAPGYPSEGRILSAIRDIRGQITNIRHDVTRLGDQVRRHEAPMVEGCWLRVDAYPGGTGSVQFVDWAGVAGLRHGQRPQPQAVQIDRRSLLPDRPTNTVAQFAGVQVAQNANNGQDSPENNNERPAQLGNGGAQSTGPRAQANGNAEQGGDSQQGGSIAELPGSQTGRGAYASSAASPRGREPLPPTQAESDELPRIAEHHDTRQNTNELYDSDDSDAATSPEPMNLEQLVRLTPTRSLVPSRENLTNAASHTHTHTHTQAGADSPEPMNLEQLVGLTPTRSLVPSGENLTNAASHTQIHTHTQAGADETGADRGRARERNTARRERNTPLQPFQDSYERYADAGRQEAQAPVNPNALRKSQRLGSKASVAPAATAPHVLQGPRPALQGKRKGTNDADVGERVEQDRTLREASAAGVPLATGGQHRGRAPPGLPEQASSKRQKTSSTTAPGPFQIRPSALEESVKEEEEDDEEEMEMEESSDSDAEDEETNGYQRL